MGIPIIVFTVTFLSAFAQMLTGFGYAIVMMALLPLFVPSPASVLLALFGGMLMSCWMLVKCRKGIRLKLIILPGIFSALGAIIGLALGLKTTDALFMRLLGVLLVVLSLWFLFFSRRAHIPANCVTGSVAGIFSGVLGAMFAIAGPPLVLYYSTVTDEKEIYMGSLQACLILLSVVSIIGRAVMNLWPSDMAAYILPSLLGLICGGLPGLYLYKKVNVRILKQIIYLFMCVAGICFIVSA